MIADCIRRGGNGCFLQCISAIPRSHLAFMTMRAPIRFFSVRCFRLSLKKRPMNMRFCSDRSFRSIPLLLQYLISVTYNHPLTFPLVLFPFSLILLYHFDYGCQYFFVNLINFFLNHRGKNKSTMYFLHNALNRLYFHLESKSLIYNYILTLPLYS